MSADQQSLENHSQYVPGFHFLTSAVIVIYLIITVYRIIKEPTLAEASGLLPALALMLLFFYTRQFATMNQDRIIRLEERLRLQRLVPPDLDIDQITDAQLIPMRFASDAELPELARRVIQERPDNAGIKKMIRTWRPDHMRV